MWPHTKEEWETITYGIKKKVKKSNILMLSAIPSLIIIVLLTLLIL
jgi:hypothetical protein